MKYLLIAVLAATAPAASTAQDVTAPVAGPAAAAVRTMPANTLITITPQTEITSKRLKLGDFVTLVTLGDVTEKGEVVIPRGSLVKGEITFKTGKAVGGKSGKFEVSFRSVKVGGIDYALTGVHRQEGKGNTVAAVFATMLVSGRSAVMQPGQEARAFTATPIPY